MKLELSKEHGRAIKLALIGLLRGFLGCIIFLGIVGWSIRIKLT
jgi:hypothetical protein